jgi:biotin carboxylase
LWVIRHLVEPFEQIVRQRLPAAGTAHRLLLEEPIRGLQYNMDGYVFDGVVHEIGIVQAIMHPGTDAFMRFDYPCGLAADVHERAMYVARRFLGAIGFTYGMFNMEFFLDPASGRLTVIEFNPRMAPQFSDLYQRVEGIDLHHMALELAWGRDPGLLAREQPVAGAASSFVYRIFDAATPVQQARAAQRQRFATEFPDGMLLEFPKPRGSMQRDFKWLGSYRYAIIHLGGADKQELRRRCERASALFGWPAPYADLVAEQNLIQANHTAIANPPMEVSP